jgi:tetratricopeptide (TPR) repeat protein
MFEKGEELFLENKPEEAMLLFETALSQEPENGKIYLYLGIIYEQLSRYQSAVDILQSGIEKTFLSRDLMYFNLGNNYLNLGKVSSAKEMYSKAIDNNNNFPDAYLNRANSNVSLKEYQDAISDYTLYLNLEPESIQKPQVEKMIILLNKVIQEDELRRLEEERKRKEEEERRKIEEEERLRKEEEDRLRKAEEERLRKAEEERKRLEEERKRKEEEERRKIAEEEERRRKEEAERLRKEAEERKRREEEEKRQALLDSVLNSLKGVSDETTNLSAGSEDIEELEEEFELED